MELSEAIKLTMEANPPSHAAFPDEFKEGDILYTGAKTLMVIEVIPAFWPIEASNLLTTEPPEKYSSLLGSGTLAAKIIWTGIKYTAHSMCGFANSPTLVVIEVNTDEDQYLAIRGNSTRYPGEKGLLVTGSPATFKIGTEILFLTATYGGNALPHYYNM